MVFCGRDSNLGATCTIPPLPTAPVFFGRPADSVDTSPGASRTTRIFHTREDVGLGEVQSGKDSGPKYKALHNAKVQGAFHKKVKKGKKTDKL